MDSSLDRLRKNIKKTSRKVKGSLKRTSKKVKKGSKKVKVGSKKVKKGSKKVKVGSKKVKKGSKKVKKESKKVHSKKVKKVHSKKSIIGGNRRKSSGRMTGGAVVTDVILNRLPFRPHICGSAEVLVANLSRLQFVACIGSAAGVRVAPVIGAQQRYRVGLTVGALAGLAANLPAQTGLRNADFDYTPPGGAYQFGRILGVISEIPQEATGLLPWKGATLAFPANLNNVVANTYDLITRAPGGLIAAAIRGVAWDNNIQSNNPLILAARDSLTALELAAFTPVQRANFAAAAGPGGAPVDRNWTKYSIRRISLNEKDVKVIYRVRNGAGNRYYITTHKGMSHTYFVQPR